MMATSVNATLDRHGQNVTICPTHARNIPGMHTTTPFRFSGCTRMYGTFQKGDGRSRQAGRQAAAPACAWIRARPADPVLQDRASMHALVEWEDAYTQCPLHMVPPTHGAAYTPCRVHTVPRTHRTAYTQCRLHTVPPTCGAAYAWCRLPTHGDAYIRCCLHILCTTTRIDGNVYDKPTYVGRFKCSCPTPRAPLRWWM